MIRIDYKSLNEELLDIKGQDLIVLSTYFTSKKDPQRDIFQRENDYQYMKDWYESIVEHNLIAFVFHDSLSDNFIAEFQNINVRFIKCSLGAFSLNDERFFIYSEFLSFFHRNIFVLATDINDVVVNKNPLPFFRLHPEKVCFGGSNTLVWRSGAWNLELMRLYKRRVGSKLSSGILNFPVFNAGLIGGKNYLLKGLFDQMLVKFQIIQDSGNYNMAVLNHVLYESYYPDNKTIIRLIGFDVVWLYYYSIIMLRGKFGLFRVRTIRSPNSHIETSRIYSGFPFSSGFKRYEKKGVSRCFLIHK